VSLCGSLSAFDIDLLLPPYIDLLALYRRNIGYGQLNISYFMAALRAIGSFSIDPPHTVRQHRAREHSLPVAGNCHSMSILARHRHPTLAFISVTALS